VSLVPLSPVLLVASQCPSLDDVAAFLEGCAAAAVSQRILEHLDACTACRLLMADSIRTSSGGQMSLGGGGKIQTFSVGETVNARYEIRQFIARGGMGEVYEAWDTQLQESIALKTIACTALDNAKLYAQFRAEVQLARRVTHPNVCRILEFGLYDRVYRGQMETIPFLTMELLAGDTLDQLIARRGALVESEVLPIALQVIDGLSAVHAAGIVHRDLKSSNVFVLPGANGKRRAVLMDFGLAQSVATQSSPLSTNGTSLAGTPAYMAPEQTLGGSPTTAWDIHALGVVLFESLSGALPFTGTSPVALAVARVNSRAPPLSSVNPRVSSAFEKIVARCLERDPKRRFTDLEELRKALGELDRGLPVPRTRRTKSIAWLALASLSILLGSIGANRQPRTMITPSATNPALPTQPSLQVAASNGLGSSMDGRRQFIDPQHEAGATVKPAPRRLARTGANSGSSARVDVSSSSRTQRPTAAPLDSRVLVESKTPIRAAEDDLAIPDFVRPRPAQSNSEHP
jgi:serine/threonine protein kinase